MHRTHNGDLEEFRGRNYEETKDEIEKGMDILSEAGVKQTYLYLQHGLVRKKQQVLSELCFIIV
jgi:hypothetical protein